jgi:hypothetical protein
MEVIANSFRVMIKVLLPLFSEESLEERLDQLDLLSQKL